MEGKEEHLSKLLLFTSFTFMKSARALVFFFFLNERTVWLRGKMLDFPRKCVECPQTLEFTLRRSLMGVRNTILVVGLLLGLRGGAGWIEAAPH